MLVWRLITAAILVPIVIAAILWLPHLWFTLLSAAFFMLAGTEWLNLSSPKKAWEKGFFFLELIIYMFAIFMLNRPEVILTLGALLWLVLSYWVITYKEKVVLPLKNWRATIGIAVLTFAWYALVFLHSINPLLIIALCLLVWSTDTFAYFSGRMWGKKRLAPTISPGKTWAGFWGGLFGSLLVAIPVFFVFKIQTSFLAWMSIAFFTILLAVLGDLFESLVKRIAGVKDSGKLLPGHGGILDRIDSLLSTLPFFALCLKFAY